MAIKTHSAAGRSLKKLWAAGVSMAFALLALAGLWLYQLPNSSNNAQSSTSPLTTTNHEQVAPKPQSNTQTTAPIADVPASKPRPTQTSTPTSTKQSQPPKTSAPQPETPAATPFSTPIRIVGDQTCRSDTLAALQLLSDKAPIYYTQVTQYIGVIECVAQGSGMSAYETPPRFLVGDVSRTAGTFWYAGIIVHDSTHSKQYNDYANSHPETIVPDTVWTGEAAESACNDVQIAALEQIGAEQWMIDYVRESLKTRWWEVPYDQRTW